MTAAQRRLINHARRARARAYAPYSGFAVGAALVSKRGRIYTGANVENASYGLTVCAERVAAWKAVTAGERGFKRIAVVADSERLTPPCGTCRQVLWELCGDIEVVLANLKGRSAAHRLRALLPKPFDASLL